MQKIFRMSIIFVLSAAIGVVACQSTTRNLGEQFMVKNPVSVDSVLMQLAFANSLKDVQIEGEIEKTCMSEGCWFTIKDATEKEIVFDIKDKKFRVPINSPGKTVIILADAQVIQESSAGEAPQKNKLLVKGLRFK